MLIINVVNKVKGILHTQTEVLYTDI